MSIENHPTNELHDAASGGSSAECAFWFELIDEGPAAEFTDQSKRTMQNLRQRGGGPKFIRLSSRSVKYRRIDLRAWAEARLVTSTSDPGLDGQHYEEPEVIERPEARAAAVRE